jgi:beta-galactosidase
VIIPAFWWDNASPPGANSMIATNCDWLELSVNGRPWLTADTGRDKLSLALADAEIAGDGSDATAVTVRVTDAYGNHRPGTAGGVALTLAGPATLIAANPFPLAALGGVGGGFIRSRPGTAGRVTLTATHAALGRAQVGLTVTSVRSETFI